MNEPSVASQIAGFFAFWLLTFLVLFAVGGLVGLILRRRDR